MTRLSSREVEALFTYAMIGLDEDGQTPADVPMGWLAIVRLHKCPSQDVLDVAVAACLDTDPFRRRVGAAVLGQLGHFWPEREPYFAEERYYALSRLLAAECEGPGDTGVLNDACVALGHLGDQRAIPALLGLRAYPEASVRFGVAFALGGHTTSEAIDGLIALSSDTDEDVRDWSIFGLAQLIDTDTAAIRMALHARLDDPADNVRNEAIEGLAARQDKSVLPFLIRELNSGVALPLLSAAIALARPQLCEALVAAQTGGLIIEASHGQYDLTETWQEAMWACNC